MSHCGTSSLYDHLDHCFVVLKHIQQSFLVPKLDVWGNTVNIIQKRWTFFEIACVCKSCEVANKLHVCSLTSRPVQCGSDSCSPRTATIRSHKSRTGIYHPTWILHPKRWFLILLNCAKLKFVFLHIQLIGTSVSRKSSEEAEVTHTLSRIWLLQFPSEQPSGYWRMMAFDRVL